MTMTGPVAAGCNEEEAATTQAPERSQAGPSLFKSPTILISLGLFVGLALSWSNAVAVWTTNRFFDTDDAMHMVQVRDWLGGQGWFDLTERRLDPPLGTLMHWTRVTDAPLAALIRMFSIFANEDAAERLTRLVYPVLLQIALYAAVLWVARKLLGFRGAAAAVILAAFSVSVVTQFAPGRINHHNLQIVLLVLMIGAIIDALDPERARRAALAAGLAAASFAISLEDAPFIAAMVAAVGVCWIVRGARFARALAWFGGGLCAAMIASFVATVPPGLYAAGVCDAFSAAHLTACCLGGAAFVLLAALSPLLPHWRSRMLACAGAGLIAVTALALAFPKCLGDPYGAVDPLVHSIWLSHVTEAQPLAKMLLADPMKTLPVAIPVFAGAALTLLAAWRETGAARARWLVMGAFASMGALGAFWEIIVASYAGAIAVFGAAWAFERLLASPRRTRSFRFAAPAILLVAMAPQSWAALAMRSAENASPYGDPQACFASSAFEALDALPPGLVLAPIDAGPYILAFTRLSALDGPYHRDNRGNRLALETLLGDAATARDKIRQAGVRYVAVCPTSDELAYYAKIAPNGFAAQLRDGRAPSWLHPAKLPDGPYRVYEVR